MSDIVISVESLWKKYRLGVVGTGTLRHDLNRWWHRVRGKPDPYAMVGQKEKAEGGKLKAESPNPQPSGFTFQPSSLSSDEIWALRDISFQVKRGEILGIIGCNGAGKSTLLKILSRVTAPTSGEVKVKGRIASLLEVGTGFHPELTGRENIFLNGAILGMTKAEIRRKLDEIIAFAEVEKYIDTPVKRYSSGMYVRLAFAVAAHLDPEILIVDEVLAVGDAAFQKKCLGKMGDVARGGRTVLFVSHNMTAVRSLCSSAVLLENGMIRTQGTTDRIVKEYLGGSARSSWEAFWPDALKAPSGGEVWLRSVRVVPEGGHDGAPSDIRRSVQIHIEYCNLVPNRMLNVSLFLYTQDDICVLTTFSKPATHSVGVSRATCHIPGGFLNDGTYRVRILLVGESKVLLDRDHLVTFELSDYHREGGWFGKWAGVVRPSFVWRTEFLVDKTDFASPFR